MGYSERTSSIQKFSVPRTILIESTPGIDSNVILPVNPDLVTQESDSSGKVVSRIVTRDFSPIEGGGGLISNTFLESIHRPIYSSTRGFLQVVLVPGEGDQLKPIFAKVQFRSEGPREDVVCCNFEAGQLSDSIYLFDTPPYTWPSRRKLILSLSQNELNDIALETNEAVKAIIGIYGSTSWTPPNT